MSVYDDSSEQSTKMNRLLLIAGLIFISASVAAGARRNVVCYFKSWTTYREGNGKFDVSDIDASLCSHIIYAFVGLGANGTVLILDDWESHQDYGPKAFENLVALKKQNPSVEIMVSMGGFNEGSEKYSKLAADPELRKVFAQNVLEFLQKWKFDGFDLFWQYPGVREGSDPVNDKDHFTALLSDLHDVLAPKYLTLSAAVAGTPSVANISYDIPAINKFVDFFNLLTFEYHGAWDNYVGHIAPLFPSFEDQDNGNIDLNVDAGVRYWMKAGADRDKINMGIATYGRSFTLANESDTEPYAAIKGPGTPGPYTKEDGALGYNEICELYPNWTRVFDDLQDVPHKINGDQWVGYEDPESIKYKVYYAKTKTIGGLMIWGLDTDDFRGICGEKYPLLNLFQSFR